MRKSQLFSLPEDDLRHLLALARPDLERLRGKRIFLTGGTGFFGKWLLGGLVFANAEMDLGLKLAVLSRNPAAFTAAYPRLDEVSEINFLRGDVARFTAENRACDFVIHGATDTTAITNEAEERARTLAILRGTQNMLELAGACGARLLNISSGGVYGAASGQPHGAAEHDIAEPVTAYGQAKLEAEDLCAESGADAVTARAFAFLGPHLPLDAHYAAGNFLRDACAGGPIRVRGDGTARRSYLYPADLVVWLLAILLRGQRGEAYNVGSDEAVTTAELARVISGCAARNAEVIVESTQAPGPQNSYLPDISRARDELGLRVAIPLREAITRTLRFLESPPTG